MTTITYRDGLGRPLTTAEMDANFRSLVDNKVEVVAGKGLSTNDYTTVEKNKLAGIASGATANQTDAYLLARANHTGTQAISTVVNLQSTLDAKIPLSQKGAANGVAPLDSSSLIPAAYLPSYVDDVLVFDNLAAFPTVGETGKIYVAADTNHQYRWSGSSYIELVQSPGTTDNVVEGATNLYFTGARVLATVLAGLNTALTGDVTNTDTVLQAFGRLQNKWNNFAASVRAVALTGLSTANLTQISATDTIINALGKIAAIFVKPIGRFYSTSDQGGYTSGSVSFDATSFAEGMSLSARKVTPTKAGYYRVSGHLTIQTSSTGTASYFPTVLKNNTIPDSSSQYDRGDQQNVPASNDAGLSFESLVYLNGIDDFICIHIYCGNALNKLYGGAALTVLNVEWLRV